MAIFFNNQLNKASLTGRIGLGISLIVIPLVIVVLYVGVKIRTVNNYADKLTDKYVDIRKPMLYIYVKVGKNKNITEVCINADDVQRSCRKERQRIQTEPGC